jgi:hypothetical protein
VKPRAGFDHGSPRRGGGRRRSWVEVVEDTGASISPKEATAILIGGSRNRRATATAIQSPESSRVRGEETGEKGRAGSVDPDPNRLVKPSQVGWVGRWFGWANMPVGPVGQQARWAKGLCFINLI